MLTRVMSSTRSSLVQRVNKRDASKLAATRDLNGALEAGWSGFKIERIPLSDIARAHELAEHPAGEGSIPSVLTNPSIHAGLRALDINMCA